MHDKSWFMHVSFQGVASPNQQVSNTLLPQEPLPRLSMCRKVRTVRKGHVLKIEKAKLEFYFKNSRDLL